MSPHPNIEEDTMSWSSLEAMPIWRIAKDLSVAVYRLSEGSNFNKHWPLKSQLQKSCISIVSNIAEGYERGGNREFIQFLYIAKGSVGEVRAQLLLVAELGLVQREVVTDLETSLFELSKMLGGFIRYLTSSPIKGMKYKE